MCIDAFKMFLLYVIDSYNSEDECMDKKILVETELPSLKSLGKLNFEIEWDYKDNRWRVESQDETYYDISSEYLVNWYEQLSTMKLIRDLVVKRT